LHEKLGDNYYRCLNCTEGYKPSWCKTKCVKICGDYCSSCLNPKTC